ncbi:hypothetical protein HDU91_005443, partial [Kappamyces sp. JEL0680]
MPELAEAEFARRDCHRILVGCTIKHVELFKDDKVWKNKTDWLQGLADNHVQFASTSRWGKYFWVSCPLGHLVFHLGMTGCVRVRGNKGIVYKTAIHYDPTQWPPAYCKLLIETSVGALAFCDPRRLGSIIVVSAP